MKTIIESIIFAIITIMLIILGIFLPFVGILAPLPLIILAVRKGSKFSIISSLFVALILSTVANPLTALIFIFTVGFNGVVMGAAFEEGFSSKLIILVGIISSFLSFIMILLVFTHILDIDIISEFKEVLESSLAMYQQSGLAEESLINIDESVNQTVDLFKSTYLAFFLVVAIINSVTNYYFSRFVLNKLDIKR